MSFQIGPPIVASQVGTTLLTKVPSCGLTPVEVRYAEVDCQESFVSVARREPLNVLPPDFVIVLMTPPVNRPYSAETDEVVVVVSWMASSMKRL